MKRSHLLLSIIILTLITTTGYGLKYDINSIKDIVYPSEKAIYEISLTNNQSRDTNYTILINGYGRTSWASLENNIIYLPPFQTKTTYLYIVPPLETEPGNYEFEIRIKNNNETETSKVAVYVKKTSKLRIINISTDKQNYNPGEEVKVLYKIKNIGTYLSPPLIIEAKIKGNKLNYNTSKQITPIKINELRRESLRLKLPKLAKGNYEIIASVYNQYYELLDTKKMSIRVKEITSIEYSQEISKGLLTKTITLKAENKGNVGSVAKLQYSLTGPRFQYELDKDSTINNDIAEWTCFLEPEQSCQKKITVNYWWVLILVIIIAILTILIIRNYFKPEFYKKYSKTEEGQYNIHIYVKNKGRKPITDIEIHDTIPGIMKFEPSKHGIKPFKINKRNEQINVIWTLDELKPGEERVISYTLKPRLAVVGGIDLKKAKLKTNTKKGSIILRETRKLTLK